jgi:hypothetical protein
VYKGRSRVPDSSPLHERRTLHRVSIQMSLTSNMLPATLGTQIRSHLPAPIVIISRNKSYRELSHSPSSPTNRRFSTINPTRSHHFAPHSPAFYLESICAKCGKADPDTSTKPIPSPPQRRPCAGISPACRKQCTCAERAAEKSLKSPKPIVTRVQLEPCGKCSAGNGAQRVVSVVVQVISPAFDRLALGRQGRTKAVSALSKGNLRERIRDRSRTKLQMRAEEKEGKQGLLDEDERRAMLEDRNEHPPTSKV